MHNRATNKSQAEAILQSINKAFQMLPFKTSNESAKIITGEKEGAFTWVAINYITGVIHSNKVLDMNVHD